MRSIEVEKIRSFAIFGDVFVAIYLMLIYRALMRVCSHI